MTVTWLLYSVLIAMLCSAAALAGSYFCRLLTIAERWVWLGAMVAVTVLSALALVGRDPLPAVTELSPADQAVVMAGEDASGTSTVLMTMRTILDAAGRAIDRISDPLLNLVGRADASVFGGRLPSALSVGTTVLLLFVLALTMHRLRMARSTWRSHRIGSVPVLVSSGTGPALVGVLRPVIVVPAWLLARPLEQQELAVRHETEHRHAGDHVFLAIACAFACLLPLNPAMWWLLRRVHLAVELDCDARILRGGTHARQYGTLLLDMAGRMPMRSYVAPAIVASRTHLERRLLAMTDLNRTPRPLRACAVGAIAVLLGLVACTTEMPTAAAIEEMEVEQVREVAAHAGIIKADHAGGQPLMIVDGVIVSDSAMREIRADAIESVEVVKGEAARVVYGQRASDGAILVTTRDGSKGREFAAVADTEMEVREVVGYPMIPDKSNMVLEADTVILHSNAASAKPLLILDGVIMPATWNLNALGPDSIENIEVLKARAARSIYGERGANGVILIMTKQER